MNVPSWVLYSSFLAVVICGLAGALIGAVWLWLQAIEHVTLAFRVNKEFHAFFWDRITKKG